MKTYNYRTTSGTGAIISSVAVILLLLIDFMFSSYVNWYFRQYANIVNDDDDVALAQWALQSETITKVSEWLYHGLIAVFIISIIFVAKWVYDSHCNARALGVQNIAYSPLMSVGVFFIPIASLFMPFVAMRDMVNGSCKIANKPTFHGLIVLWWVCFISGSLIYRFYHRKLDNLDSKLPDEPDVTKLIEYFEQLANTISILQIGSLLTLISAVALIIIIKRTSHLHHNMHQNNVVRAAG